MKSIKIFILLQLACILFACNNTESVFILEEESFFTNVDLLGIELIVRGTIGDEPFEFTNSGDGVNLPSNQVFGISPHPTHLFGTEFIIDRIPSISPRLILGITKDALDDKWEDQMQVGVYDVWTNSNDSGGLGYVAYVDRDDFGTSGFSLDWFEITSITPINLDDNLENEVNGQLYHVEGKFRVKFRGSILETIEADYFSAIFLDPA